MMRRQVDGTFVFDDRPWLFFVGLLVFAACFGVALWNRIAAHGIDTVAVLIAAGLGASVVGALAIPNTRFVFDLNRKQIRWSSRSFVSGDGGELDFANVRSVIVQKSDDPNHNAYRVALDGPQKLLPLGIEYNANKDQTEQLAATIRELLTLPPPSSDG